jgi:putative glutamine amidotransferase
MNLKPVIGVSGDRRIVDPHPFHMAGEKYLHALIEGSNALPLIIPALGDLMDIDEILANVDGLLFTGSPSNVEPHHYDGESSEPGTLHDPNRDSTTLPLAKRAFETGVPVLALCRGHQEFNVVLGGTLHQKVHEVPGHDNHRENPDVTLPEQYGPAHEVNLVEGGLLHGLAGTTTVMVNSLHSQGVAKLAAGVTVEAVAPDGLIEAFVVDSAKGFALSIQWHPEWKVTESEFSMGIFKTFGDACQQYAATKQV